ncbi:MAG: cysteine--tRNA ligase [Bacteroidota bacterium]|nr:cysteine--tRNA ligase [Bacteroidota bacterium]
MLRLFNTLSRTKEEFIPIDPGEVRMYSCGPTVYNYAHVGNLRTFFFEDILLRVLKYNDFRVNYVMNITDVGHLVTDADEGEDKIELSAKQQGKSVWELSEYYTKIFKRDISLMNIIPPDTYTKATDFIKEQIDLIKCLEEKGYTYITSDGVYFDTSKLKDYGKLAMLDIKGLQEGARIEFSPEKKNITDFSLWKFSPENESRQMEWESPWGIGFPGWHIECSAMSKAKLGDHIDIHCGGIDHIPIHHTNEIAQSEACSGEKFVNYWLHGEFLDMAGEKMSRSTGRFITLQTFIDDGYDPMDYRYFLLMAHYKKKLKFTFEALNAAKNGLRNLTGKILNLKNETSDTLLSKPVKLETLENDVEVKKRNDLWREKFLESVNDDLNMPEAMAVLWDMLRDEKLSSEIKLSLSYNFDEVFGLGLDKKEQVNKDNEIPEDIVSLSNKRNEAKRNKDFKLADDLRNQLKEKGFEVLDKKDGTVIKKINLGKS